MWSGPRNISTAMMRAFENRPDTAVVDEPFYAAYLAATGADHPMREDVIATQPTDWRDVVKTLLGPIADGRAIFYQKHMTHHMLPRFGRDWARECRNAFLIRRPEDVLASYANVRDEVSLEAIGLPQQRELFASTSDWLGRAPPVVDSHDILSSPRGLLHTLCEALDIPFTEQMLSWPPGRRASDGVWAPAWYASVERSTAFSPPRPPVHFEDLRDDLKPIAEEARPIYDELARFKLTS
ncbi:MAG: HAD family hydrolase [Alphaproteobacteria bacterium]|nr:HAD family hydrolase [Alphaproteobacteria bacterium]